MVEFHTLDWIWLISYLVLMVSTGVVFYRLGRKSESDFFLAGRGLPWWLPAASVFATHTATDSPMWVGSEIYDKGLVAVWITFAAPAWCAVSAFVSTRIFRRSLAYTQAEWQAQRFGGLGSELLRGWLAGWQIFMQMLIMGWVSFAMGRVCEYFFGWPPWLTIGLFAGVAAIYTLASGYWGVVVADFQQGIIAFFAILMVSGFAIYAVGGPAGLTEKLSAMGESERTNPFAFTGAFEGDFSVAWLVTLLLFAFSGGVGMGVTVDWYTEAQRIQSARTVRDASYSIWAGSAVLVVIQALWASAVLCFYAYKPGIEDSAEYELAWYRVGFENLPPGLIGFLFAAIVAIHVSTISSSLNLGSLYFTRDLYQRYLNPNASERQLVHVARVTTAILLGGAFFYSSLMQDVTSWVIFALFFLAAGMLIPNLLQVVWWRFNSWGFLSAWMSTLGFSWLVIWILPLFGFEEQVPESFQFLLTSNYGQFWLLVVIGMIVYIPVTFLTRAEDMDHLVRFYVQSRPIGWWGPVKREAQRRGLL